MWWVHLRRAHHMVSVEAGWSGGSDGPRVVAQLKGSLGHYANETDAAEAYDARAVELFGEYAVTNHALGLYPIAEHHPSATAGGGSDVGNAELGWFVRIRRHDKACVQPDLQR
jgi:hypothetical protein